MTFNDVKSENRLAVNFKNHWYGFIAVIVSLICLALTYRRLFFGVDFSDEAFYAAVPLRFLNGGKPFVDEVNVVMQFPSFFIAPFLGFYVSLTGGTDGMMLFLRHLYLASTCFTGAIVFLILKKKIVWPAALLSAMVPIIFIPYAIPALSYNTIAFNFFLLGCFLVFLGVSSVKKVFWMMIPGIIHGLSALSYPTLLMPIFFVAVILCFFNKRFFFFYLAGVAIVLFLALIFLVNIGIPALKASYEYTRTVGGQLGGIEKFSWIISQAWNGFSYKVWLFLLIGAVSIGIAKKIKFFAFVLLFLPLLLFFLVHGESCGIGSAEYVAYYSLFPLLLFFFLRKGLLERQLFYLIYLPSFAAGVTAAWSSGNGFIGSFLGFVPAFITTSLFVFFLWDSISVINSKMGQYLSFIPFVGAIGVLLFIQNSLVYRDDPLSELTKKVESGPYAGIFTTPEKNLYMEDFIDSVRSVDDKNKRILIYDEFPAGYLFAKAIPATNTVWLRSASSSAPGIDRASTLAYIDRQNIVPDVAIRMKKIFISTSEIRSVAPPPNDLLDKFIVDNGYKKIKDEESYDIYER